MGAAKTAGGPGEAHRLSLGPLGAQRKQSATAWRDVCRTKKAAGVNRIRRTAVRITRSKAVSCPAKFSKNARGLLTMKMGNAIV